MTNFQKQIYIQKYQKLKITLQILQNKKKNILLRSQANIENFKKKYIQEIQQIKNINMKNFIHELYKIINEFNIILQNNDQSCEQQSTIQGIKLIKKSLDNTINKFQIQ